MIVVSCAALLTALANPAGGGSFRLAQDCGPRLEAGIPAAAIAVRVVFQRPVTLDLGGRTVAGLSVIDGGRMLVRGGVITAPGGVDARGSPGYGVWLRRTSEIVLDNISVRDANRGVATGDAVGLTIRNSRFEMGQDGIISSGGRQLLIEGNRFVATSMKPTSCSTSAGVVTNIRRRDCEDRGGTWTDGWHQDAVQLRNGIAGVVVRRNVIRNVQQGIGEMSATTDARLADVVIEDNDVEIVGTHSITLAPGSTGRIAKNRVRQMTGRRTVIRFGDTAEACGNDTQRAGDPGGGRCRRR